MEKEIELESGWAVISLPVESVEVNVEAKIFHDGEIVTVKNTMNLSDIRTAFKKADDGYIDEDDMFVLTESGKEHLDSIKLE